MSNDKSLANDDYSEENLTIFMRSLKDYGGRSEKIRQQSGKLWADTRSVGFALHDLLMVYPQSLIIETLFSLLNKGKDFPITARELEEWDRIKKQVSIYPFDK